MKKATLNKITGDLTIEHEIENIDTDQKFVQKGHMVITSGNFKGIVFNISNNDTSQPCLTTVAGGNTLELKAIIRSSEISVEPEEIIRIMFYNEQDPQRFIDSKSYFEARLLYYTIYKPGGSLVPYSKFSIRWNDENQPSYPIDMQCGDQFIPRQTIKDDILSVKYE